MGPEACDDGNPTDGDGCSSTCAIEAGYTCPTPGSPCQPVCGDGITVSTDVCDPGPLPALQGCNAGCTGEVTGFNCTGSGPSVCVYHCGDGLKLGPEACDDGNLTPSDGCTNNQIDEGHTCSTAIPNVCSLLCGDGTVQSPEACDDGNTDETDGCDNECKVVKGWECPDNKCSVVNGDGIRIKDKEGCDDGNTVKNDGCSDKMVMEQGFLCYSKLDNDTFPAGVTTEHDTYCEMPKTAANEAAKGSASIVPILMGIKFITSLKLDPGAWAMINAIQLVRAFTLLNVEMPANLRHFLTFDIGAFSLQWSSAIDFLKKFIP